MICLGIDVCTGACAVAAVDGERVLARRSEPMARGHAERLAPMTAEVLVEAGLRAADLDGVAVTTGPGSFTGARLGVAFARGLALSTGAVPVGISVFAAMAVNLPEGRGVIAIDGRRGDLFVQCFERGAALAPPSAETVEHAREAIVIDGSFAVIGSGRAALFDSMPDAARARVRAMPPDVGKVDPEIVARLGTRMLAAGTAEPPAPLYLRAPDAVPVAARS